MRPTILQAYAGPILFWRSTLFRMLLCPTIALHRLSTRLRVQRISMWHGVFGTFVFLLALGCDNARTQYDQDATPNGQVAQTITLCHTAEDSTFTPLETSQEDMATHLLHGDGVPTGAVPGMHGFVFTATCQPEPDSDEGPCTQGMAHIDGFCIDRWEAHLEDHSPYTVPMSGIAQTAPGVIPQGYISADVAEAACQAAGKRLCTSQEWLRACRGSHQTQYPYGNTYSPSACNESRTVHPVLEVFGNTADWSKSQMNDARLNQLANGLDSAGAHPACMSTAGVFDLHGNLHEWVSDASGLFRGGFYVDAEINGLGCSYRTTAHGRSYHDYSTGFRCCADAQ